MPSTSKKQHNFMAAVANNPSFAKKVGVPQSVGKEFTTADKNRKFSKGGDMKAEMMKKGGMPPALAKHAAKPASKAHKGLAGGGMTSMGSVRTAAPSKDGLSSVKTKGTMVKMSGSKPLGMKSGGKTC
jgi:hypothetical protein